MVLIRTVHGPGAAPLHDTDDGAREALRQCPVGVGTVKGGEVRRERLEVNHIEKPNIG